MELLVLGTVSSQLHEAYVETAFRL